MNIAAGLKPVGNGGKITVNVLNGGNLEFLAGRDAQTYVQLGHGGRSTRDSHSGDIEVHVSGGIRFLASVDGLGLAGDNWGNNDDGYAQLGHGGHASSGSHSGNITVTAGTFADGLNEGRSIVFRGGNDSNTYAQLGHGGRDTVSYGTGADAVGLSGDISVTAASDILFVAGTVGGRDLWDNTGGGNYVQLGHGGYNSDTEVNRASVTGLFGPDGKPVGHSGNITVVSGGSVEFLAGDTNRAYEPSVGENGGTFHYAQIGHGGYSSYGNHYGDITVRAGMQPDYTVTNANARVYFAGGVVATSQWADQNSYAQLGHGGREAFGNMGLRTADDSALDTIKVLSGGDIVFTAAASGVNSYVTLGNGGYQARGDHAANIEAYAGADILFEGGQLPLTPTLATGAYGRYSWAGTDANAQTRSLDWAANLHTGTANPGAVNGVAGRVNINFSRVVNGSIVITIRDTTLAVVGRLVQVGNYLVAENDITANFGTGVETILAGTQVAAIGNGGVLDNGASATGTTHITFLRDVNPGANDGTANLALEFVHGVGERAYAQLGNGGYEADNVNGVIDRGNNGTINVTSVGGNIDFLGGSQSLTSAQLGHGGYLNFGHNDGDIAVRALDGGVNFASGTNTSFVQLGHGGRDAQGNHSGNILVEALGAGGVRFTSGLVANAAEVYAQLGHGGRAARGDHSGNIVVRSRDDIVFTGGSGAQNYVQLGHGGYDSDNPNDNTTLGNTGSISVASTAGDLIFQAGNANNTYAHLGHGGGANKGANTGDIVARAAGSVVVKGGSGTQAYAQVGHGGYDADGDHGVNALVSSDVIVSAGSGALGTHLGTGLFDDLGDIDGIAGADTVQFAPVPTGKGKVEVSGGTGTDTYAMVGHGGRSAGNTAGSASTMNGKVGVEAYGDIVLQGGTGTRGFVQVGHGGWEDAMNMALSGDISVVSRTGRLDVLAGNGSEAYSLVGHGTLRNAVANGPSGSRSGFVYVEVGSWHIAPVGTTSLARIGHRSNATNNGVSTADRFTLLGTGSDGTTSHTVDAALWALIGAADHVSAGGDATFGGVDLTMDQAISGNSAGKINLLATGNLDVRKSVQNSGTGAVSVVAGWDGHTGMSGGLPSGELDFLAHVPMRIFDIAPVIATDASWGNNGGVATVGGGAQTTGVAVGSARGATTVLGDAVKVIGSNTATNGYALVGAVPVVGVSPTGAIVVKAREGGVAVEGGNAALTYAQIGHRALGTVIPALSGNILVDSLGSLTLKGGVGLLSSAQIGHGANSATANIGGTVTVKVANDIDAVGGSGGGAYSQIGHGGLFTKGNLHDGIKVDAGGNVRLSAPNLAVNSYAKIGHGDDVRGTSASLGGTGDRAGNIELTSGESIEMQSALVGHVNGDSSATPVAGSHTWIALVDENGELLIDPSAGNLIADATSEFSGADEVRLYVPRRANNQVAAGAKINGFAYDGGVDDPQLVQRPDEYTNHWIDGENGTSGTLGQRDTLLGSGPDPVVSAGYAFYYDLIEIGTPPPVVPTDPGAGGNSGGGSAGGGGQAVQRATDYRRLVPDDRTRDEWRRKQEREYSRWGDYGIYYEGYSQYGLHGESVYDWKKEKAEEEGAED
ncbi:MAG TPA: hypothetical protein PLA50_01245 [Bacteroidia bacterium]|nr:hypothetical protein [Bacteroidia bacterium]